MVSPLAGLARTRPAIMLTATIAAVVLAAWVGAGDAAAWPWDNLDEKAGDVAKGLVARLVNGILWVLIGLMQYVMSFFVADRTNLDADSFTEMITWATSYTYHLQSVFLFVSIIWVAGRLALAQWTGGGQAAVTSGMILSARALATSLGAATVVILLTRASDILAAWIYDDTGTKVEEVTDQLQDKIGTIDADNFDGSSLLLVIICMIAILGCLDLILQLFLRLFYLAFGTAILPLAAAASGTEGGQATYHQVMKLLIAMIAFKPICAGAFAMAMAFPVTDSSDAGDVFTAVLFYIAPILCLPTLLVLVGVGGSIHGRVSGLAGVGALMVGGRAMTRLPGRAAGSARGVAASFGRGGGGGGTRGPGGTGPTGTRPVPGGPRSGGGGRPGGGPGGGGGGGSTPRPASATSGGGGGSNGGGATSGPRSGRHSPASAQASSTSAGPGTSGSNGQSSGQSGPGATSASGGQSPAGGPPSQQAGRHAADAGTSSRASGPPRPSGPRPSAPVTPRPPTVGDQRASAGDPRLTAKAIARRNLGTHTIRRGR